MIIYPQADTAKPTLPRSAALDKAGAITVHLSHDRNPGRKVAPEFNSIPTGSRARMRPRGRQARAPLKPGGKSQILSLAERAQSHT